MGVSTLGTLKFRFRCSLCSCIRTNLKNPRWNSGLFKVDSACNLPSHHETNPPFPLCLSATKILRERPDKIPVTTIHRWHEQWEESELFPRKGLKHKNMSRHWGLFEKNEKVRHSHASLSNQMINYMILYACHVACPKTCACASKQYS